MVINDYKFGLIIVEGKKYYSDVIIYPTRVDDHWWRKEGHLVLPQDLEEVIKEEPALLIIGTGDSGLMKVPEETVRWIKSKKIELIIEPTSSACQSYNKFHQWKRTIAALHLTC